MNDTADDILWRSVKAQALEVLKDCARNHGKLTYSEFIKKITVMRLGHHGDPRLTDLLDEISGEEFAAGRGLISVLVVTSRTQQPSNGFYQLAKSYCPDMKWNAKGVEAERKRVWTAHEVEGRAS